MPYIQKQDREKFAALIETTIGVLRDDNDNPYLKGEFFGYFVNRLARKFLGTQDYTNVAFNSSFFNESKKKALENAADSIAVQLVRSDPMSAAGELNYAISAVYWGFLGDKEGVAAAKYGMRAYLNGILDKIVSNIDTISAGAGNAKDATMMFRRIIVVRGVLDHIKFETYRRVTMYYEDEKRMENGDVWTTGKLQA